MTTEHPRPDQTEAAIPAAEPLKDGDIVAFDGASTPDPPSFPSRRLPRQPVPQPVAADEGGDRA